MVWDGNVRASRLSDYRKGRLYVKDNIYINSEIFIV